MRLHDDWERARILATITVQPHLRNKITAEALLPLPWDKDKQHKGPEAPKLTPEERKARFEKLVKQLDNNGIK